MYGVFAGMWYFAPGSKSSSLRAHRRRDALVLLAQLPPRRVVVLRLHFAGEHFPAPLVDQLAERQERDLVERELHLLVDRRLIAALDRADQADLVQVRRRHRQVHRVADRFVEAVVRAALEHVRLLVVRQVVKEVAELVIHRHQVFLRRLDALLDAHVVLAVHVPCAGVALHVAVARLREQRALPESLRQFREAERDVEALSRLRDAHRIVFLLLQRAGHVEVDAPGYGSTSG